MNAPGKSNFITAGYRVSANTTDTIVTKCCNEVKAAYLLAFVTEAQITAASLTDTVGQAWLSLGFLRLLQDTEFATRTGGERKGFEYGERSEYRLQTIKAECNMWLRKLESEFGKIGDITDICSVYFKTQMFG